MERMFAVVLLLVVACTSAPRGHSKSPADGAGPGADGQVADLPPDLAYGTIGADGFDLVYGVSDVLETADGPDAAADLAGTDAAAGPDATDTAEAFASLGDGAVDVGGEASDTAALEAGGTAGDLSDSQPGDVEDAPQDALDASGNGLDDAGADAEDAGLVDASDAAADIAVPLTNTCLDGQLLGPSLGAEMGFVTRIAPLPDAGYLAAGRHLARLDAAGALVWMVKLWPDYLTRDLVPLPDGSASLLAATQGAPVQAIWQHVGTGGQVLATVTVPAVPGSSTNPTRMIRMADGSYRVVGSLAGVDGASAAWLARLDADGGFVEQAAVPGPGQAQYLSAVTQVSAGPLIGGWAINGPMLPDAGWLCQLPQGGSPGCVWSKTYGLGDSARFSALAPMTDGGAIAAGVRQAAGTGIWKAWILRVDKAGAIVWERLFAATPVAGSEYFAIDTMPDNNIIASGRHGDLALLVRYDGGGALKWWKTLAGPGPQPADFRDVRVLPGGFVMGGGTLASLALAARTDIWGHFQCESGGPCAGLTQKNCNDANGCTTDECDPGVLCHHAPVPDGLWCGYYATTTSQACQASVCK